MKVFISADMEGITGLVSWSQCGENTTKCYDFAFARDMMIHDVNAAIEGAREAGADEIVVRDGHGNSKSLLASRLSGPVTLISGCGHSESEGMMTGLDRTFDAAMLIGYHAMAGTPAAIMEHTLTGGIHRLKLNGVETGEMGLSAHAAGIHGVPLVTVSSDLAGCQEAQGLVDGVCTAQTKIGLTRYSGKLVDPERTRALIMQAARDGVTKRKEIKPKVMNGTCRLELEYNRTEMAGSAAKFPGLKLTDGYTLAGDFPSFLEAHVAIWNMMALEGSGSRSHD